MCALATFSLIWLIPIPITFASPYGCFQGCMLKAANPASPRRKCICSCPTSFLPLPKDFCYQIQRNHPKLQHYINVFGEPGFRDCCAVWRALHSRCCLGPAQTQAMQTKYSSRRMGIFWWVRLTVGWYSESQQIPRDFMWEEQAKLLQSHFMQTFFLG